MRLGKQARSQEQAQPEFQQLMGAPALVPSRNSRLSGLPSRSLDGEVSGPQPPPTQTLPGAPFSLTGRRCRGLARSCQSHFFLLTPDEIMITLND